MEKIYLDKNYDYFAFVDFDMYCFSIKTIKEVFLENDVIIDYDMFSKLEKDEVEKWAVIQDATTGWETGFFILKAFLEQTDR